MRGNRRCIALMGAGWLVLAAAPPKGQDTGNEQQETQRADAALKKVAERDVTTKPCPQSEDHRDSDLCAQWKAADAATSAALAAWIIGSLGALIGGATLIAAIMAAKYAKKAAEETKRAADAALDTVAATREGNGLSRDAYAAQLRPYLQFADPKTEEPQFQRGEQIPFAFQNFGQTPAQNVEIDWCWQIVKRPIGKIEISHFTPRQSYGSLAPGQKIEDHMANDLTPAEVARIAAGEVLLLRMRLHYSWENSGQGCHDLTFSLSNSGHRPWKFGQLSSDERERT